ncbi:MAG: O-antigen ligase family protein [Clostridiales Family XIII bacterium]|jgi:O-antigen ligase|nr:O-antigen ligase family protein [Clostridiales Family XIII bacterium]
MAKKRNRKKAAVSDKEIAKIRAANDARNNADAKADAGGKANKATVKAKTDNADTKTTAAAKAKNARGQGARAAKAGKAGRVYGSGDPGYLFSMSHAPRIDQGQFGLQLIPAAIFSAIVILIVHQYNYFRDMSGYYWSAEQAPTPGQTNQVEFFSHYKVVLIEVCAVLVLLMILYRVVTQQFAVKKSNLYIPMLVYTVFVFLSFLLSDNKDVAWNGWNDRFEGTAVILSYMLLLFYIINSVNNERNIKWIIYPLAGSTVLLSALGISQATGHDFFQTPLGQKLLVPNKMLTDGSYPWDLIDQAAEKGEQFLKFTFQNNEIYQTVYNINYVSFYLTLLIPIFGMLFVRESKLAKKILWGVIFALVVFNIMGSASSGGFLGLFVVFVLAVIILNKRLLKWWKSVVSVIAIVVIVGISATAVVNHFGGVLWYNEIKGAVSSSVGAEPEAAVPDAADAGEADAADGADPSDPVAAGAADGADPAAGAADASDAAAADPSDPAADAATTAVPEDFRSDSKIDYFITRGDTLTLSLNGEVINIAVSPEGSIAVTDKAGTTVGYEQNAEANALVLADEKFADLIMSPQQDDEGNLYLVLSLMGEQQQWPFMLSGAAKDTLLYRNEVGKTVSLVDVPHIGWADNPGFGSGRGFIWSRSLPLIKDTIFIGHGADTYCVYFPHKDYIGKYNEGWGINIIVDKPHNMYIHAAIGTGVISLLAMLALFILYAIQSFKLYWREEFDSFASFVGAGIFFGISGFVVSGFVDDSTVSVMPMFYGLLGTGIAINMMIKRRRKTNEVGG